MSSDGWIGVDFDRTLAFYTSWREHGLTPGPPLKPMQALVKQWLAEGRDVRIVTARVGSGRGPEELLQQQDIIRKWCEEHLGQGLPMTDRKDFGMLVLYDDRAVRVEANTGVPFFYGDEEEGL